MKSIFAVVGVVAALTGCATQQPYYTSAPVPHDPYQWHTVSVTPSTRAPGQSSAPVYTVEEAPPRVVYTQPQTTYVTEPSTTYITQPSTVIYQPAPVYYPQPSYYYPPVSIGLNFGFTRFSGGRGYHGGWGGRGGWRR